MIGSGGAETPTSNLGRISSWGEIQHLLRERSDFSDLEFGPLIGKGSFGRVYKGEFSLNMEDVEDLCDFCVRAALIQFGSRGTYM